MRLRGLCWGLLWASSLLLWGCAGGVGPGGPATGGAPLNASGQDLVTASDEPETRERARLRLELARGYFEQGQTTVALDQVKQSLAADPLYAPALNLRGLIYVRLGEFRLAEASFQQALRINARDGDTHHNLGWAYCQEGRYPEAVQAFGRALQVPGYTSPGRTWLTQGICQARGGLRDAAEASLTKAYELEPGNPITAYNLAALLQQRGQSAKAQFYIRRLNNSELANAESLWLGIRVENRLGNREVVRQLGDQLKRRYPQSRELSLYERGAYDE